jgi:hypothetical protein
LNTTRSGKISGLIRSIRTLIRSIRTLIRSIRTLIRSIRTLIRSIRTLIRSIRTLIRSIRTLIRSIRTLIRSIRTLVCSYCPQIPQLRSAWLAVCKLSGPHGSRVSQAYLVEAHFARPTVARLPSVLLPEDDHARLRSRRQIWKRWAESR